MTPPFFLFCFSKNISFPSPFPPSPCGFQNYLDLFTISFPLNVSAPRIVQSIPIVSLSTGRLSSVSDSGVDG